MNGPAGGKQKYKYRISLKTFRSEIALVRDDTSKALEAHK